MTDRISLVEAYDNRDVIAQLVRDREDLREIKEILANLPNPDLTNCVLKTGNQTIAGVKTFTDQVVLSGGMDLNALGALTVNGDLLVDGDIVQSGAAYETHVEQIFSHNDLMIMRDGAVNALPAGSYSGLQVKKYDGSQDCRMVIDNSGTFRVGDVNDEKPLMVRDEAADLSGGDVLLWDSVNLKAIGQAKDTVPASGSSAVVTSDGIYTALSGKGITNAVTQESFSGVAVTAGVVTSLKQITLTEAGTYLLVGVVSASTAMGSGLSVKGFDINGTLEWISTNAATGDGQYASFMRVNTLAANSTVDMQMYTSAVSVTVSGSVTAVRLV